MRLADGQPEGEYKFILQLVGVLSHGKVAKKLTDRAIDMMEDVQNLRKAIYEYARLIIFTKYPADFVRSNKLKAEACEKGTSKHRKLFNLAVNYL